MLIGALSLVMQVWLGISRKASRRSTHTGRSMSGIRNTRPGPLRPIDRPKRKTTRRWYSRTTFTASGITMSATIATTIGQKSSPNKEPSMGTPPGDTKRRLRIISCGSSSTRDRGDRHRRWGMAGRGGGGIDIGGGKRGVGVRDLIYVTVSTGIGGGLIFNGDLYHGVSGTAGEIGHMTVEPDGPVCTCGRRGHLEGLASGHAIARMAEEAVHAGRQTRLTALPPGALDAAVVAQAALDGDAVAREIYARACHYIGIAVASLVNVLNPAMVVFGGGVSKVGDLLFDTVRRVVRERAFEHPAEAAKIVPAALGDDVGVIGAAAVVYRRAAS